MEASPFATKRPCLEHVAAMTLYARESEAEVVYYTRELRNGGGTLPNISTALRFACESLYHEDACGVHGTDKYYIDPRLIFIRDTVLTSILHTPEVNFHV
jgi:hypothetical protein